MKFYKLLEYEESDEKIEQDTSNNTMKNEYFSNNHVIKSNLISLNKSHLKKSDKYEPNIFFLLNFYCFKPTNGIKTFKKDSISILTKTNSQKLQVIQIKRAYAKRNYLIITLKTKNHENINININMTSFEMKLEYTKRISNGTNINLAYYQKNDNIFSQTFILTSEYFRIRIVLCYSSSLHYLNIKSAQRMNRFRNTLSINNELYYLHVYVRYSSEAYSIKHIHQSMSKEIFIYLLPKPHSLSIKNNQNILKFYSYIITYFLQTRNLTFEITTTKNLHGRIIKYKSKVYLTSSYFYKLINFFNENLVFCLNSSDTKAFYGILNKKWNRTLRFIVKFELYLQKIFKTVGGNSLVLNPRHMNNLIIIRIEPYILLLEKLQVYALRNIKKSCLPLSKMILDHIKASKLSYNCCYLMKNIIQIEPLHHNFLIDHSKHSSKIPINNKIIISMIQEEIETLLRNTMNFTSLRKIKFLEIIFKQLIHNTKLNKRSIYYSAVPVFQAQATVDQILKYYLSKFNCTMADLNINPGRKGIFYGLVNFVYSDKVLTLSGHNLIPEMTSVKKVEHSYGLILVVEKESIFNKCISNNHITVCGKGYACFNTLFLLKQLEGTAKIYCLTDFDPHGFSIYLNYKKHISSIQRIGISSADLLKYQIDRREIIRMTIKDSKMIENLLSKLNDKNDNKAVLYNKYNDDNPNTTKKSLAQENPYKATQSNKTSSSNIINNLFISNTVKNDILFLKGLGFKVELEAITTNLKFVIDEYIKESINKK